MPHPKLIGEVAIVQQTQLCQTKAGIPEAEFVHPAIRERMGLASINALIPRILGVPGIRIAAADNWNMSGEAIAGQEVVVAIVIDDGRTVLGREIPVIPGVDVVEVLPENLPGLEVAKPTVASGISGQVRYR